MTLLKRLRRIVSSHIEDLVHESVNSKSSANFQDPPDNFKESDHSRAASLDDEEFEFRKNLEVSKDASYTEIRANYKRLMRLYHPDFHVGDESKRKTAEEITQKLNEAMNYFDKKYGD